MWCCHFSGEHGRVSVEIGRADSSVTALHGFQPGNWEHVFWEIDNGVNAVVIHFHTKCAGAA